MSDNLYSPANTVEAQQYGIEPVRRVNISLPVGLANGFVVPQLSGRRFYVERCDYPFRCVLVTNSAGGLVSQSIVLREGDRIDATFKQVTLYGPDNLGGLSGESGPVLSLLVGESGCYGNDLATVQTRFGAASRILSNTAVLQTRNLHVPPGVRRLIRCTATLNFTTMTAYPQLSFLRLDGSGVCTNSQVTTNGQTYAGESHSFAMYQQANPFATGGLFSADNLVVPPDAGELTIQLNGTGLGAPIIQAVWA